MRNIEPSISKTEILCAEEPAPPTGLVVFGASGDLTGRALLPSVFELALKDLLPAGQQQIQEAP